MNLKSKIIILLIFICIVALLIILGGIIYIVSDNTGNTITNPSDYEKALSVISNKKEIVHFPKTIPNDATDVKLYCWKSSTNGELLILTFKINKEYLSNELKRHTFINQNDIVGSKQNIYFFPQKCQIKPEKFTFYVLKTENNISVYKDYFPYFSGIGIDKNFEKIIYYYIEPDD